MVEVMTLDDKDNDKDDGGYSDGVAHAETEDRSAELGMQPADMVTDLDQDADSRIARVSPTAVEEPSSRCG
jgi:hypothetical protein